MPAFVPYTPRQLRAALATVGDAMYGHVAPLAVTAWRTPEPEPFSRRIAGERLELGQGEAWGRAFDAAWFRFRVQVPDDAPEGPLALVLDVGAELLVVDGDGHPLRGLTNARLAFEEADERAGKVVLPVGRRTRGERLEVWADAGCNELAPDPEWQARVRRAELVVVHGDVVALYYDVEVLLDLLGQLPEDSPRAAEVLTALTDAGRLLYRGLPGVAGQAREVLRPALARRGGDPALEVSAIGHAHLDLAWLWPLREGARKAVRTFATALANLREYPGYVFGASQAQLYQWVKDQEPELYEQVREAVRHGRIEPLGAMWVEADTNVPGGESLVRQLLLGKRFYRQEFGVEARAVWLPDSFGFSGALPQLLKKAGVRYFTTQKLSWSLVNRFPHHSFVWQGIDGSRVLAHMLPEEEYNSAAAPRSVRKLERTYRDKGVSRHALLAYGLGDGGGGPGEQHLERLARLRDLQGLSPVRQEAATAFYERWEQARDRFAVWVGELYLERHQGTLTTQARTKWLNRRLELGLRDLEWTAALARVLTGAEYPREWLDRAWREVLLYQFHDILPGSSIRRVYEECVPRLEVLLQELQAHLAGYDRRLAAAVGREGDGSRQAVGPGAATAIVQNSLPWPRSDWVLLAGTWREVRVPAMGYAVLSSGDEEAEPGAVGDGGALASAPPPLIAAPDLLENEVLRVRFAADGSIASLWDKRLQRELITPGQSGNRLAVYVDDGDVWDFPTDYAEQEPRQLELTGAEAGVDGSRAVVRQQYRLGPTRLEQQVVLMAGGARLDFHTTARWREPRAMLRTSFPVTPQAEDATFEIQFGSIRRPTHSNTSWDLARTEVAAHKWADLSQGDMGVALLNDGKYGHRIKDGVIDLNLLRSVKYVAEVVAEGTAVAGDEPDDRFTDQTDHEFTYSLYPHEGDHVAGRVIEAAYELNVPLRATLLEAGAGDGPAAGEGPARVARGLPPAAGFLRVEPSTVMVEAVKLAEDGDDLVLRLYETSRRGVVAQVHLGFTVMAAAEVDLLEEHPAPLDVEDDGLLTLVFLPFEIKTVRVTPMAADRG